MSHRLLLRHEAVYLGLITAVLLLMTDCVTWFHTHAYTHTTQAPNTLSGLFGASASPSPCTCILFQPKLPAASDSQITVHTEMIAIRGLPPPNSTLPTPNPCLMFSERSDHCGQIIYFMVIRKNSNSNALMWRQRHLKPKYLGMWKWTLG